MSNGVKFPDILKHENENFPIVDSNDVRGFYIAESKWDNFDLNEIPIEKRRNEYLVFARGSLYQYIGPNLTNEEWVKRINWLTFGISNGDTPLETIPVYPNNQEVEQNGNGEKFIACKETSRIYTLVSDEVGDYPIDGDGVIASSLGPTKKYVDITLKAVDNAFLKKSNNLSDVNDRVIALRNITDSENANVGDILYVDESHNIRFKQIPDIMHIEGRVDTVEELPLTAKKGDVYLVGEEGSADFEEYVCLTENPATWEKLGKTGGNEIWKNGGEGYETAIRPIAQGYINGADSILLLTPESTVLSSNTIVSINPIEGEESSNMSIISSNNIEIKNYSHHTVFIATENQRCSCFAYTTFISNQATVLSAPQISGSRSYKGYDALSYSLIASNYSNIPTESLQIGLKGIGISFIGNQLSNAGNQWIGDEISCKSIFYGFNDITGTINDYGEFSSVLNNVFGTNTLCLKNSVLLSNYLSYNAVSFNKSVILSSDIRGTRTDDSDGLNALKNHYINNLFVVSSDIRNGNFSTDILSVIRYDLTQGAVINSKITNFLLYGERVGLLLTDASGFVMAGKDSLITASNITNGAYKHSYSVVESSKITTGGYGNNAEGGTASYHKHFTLSSISVSSSFSLYEDSVNELSSEFVSISATEISSTNIGIKHQDDTYNFLKYSNIDSSKIEYYQFAGNYNNISSSYFRGGYMDGDYLSILSGNLQGTELQGSYNAIVSSTLNGGSITGTNNIVGSTNISGLSISGNYNTILSANGGQPSDKLGNYVAQIATKLSEVPVDVEYSAAIALNYGRLKIQESYTLYTTNLCAEKVRVCDEVVFESTSSNKITTTNAPLTIDTPSYPLLINAQNVYVNGKSILGKMGFKGEVISYEDLPENANVGDVYSIQEAVDVYDGFTPETVIGVYPPSTNFVKTENGYESLGGYISYISDDRIDEICVLD